MTARAGNAAPRLGAPRPAALLLVALLVAACGAATATNAPVPASSSVAPNATASGDLGQEPKPTSWPGGVVEAVLNLAKADQQIETAGKDLTAAAANEDLDAMRGAADGLATLIERLQGQVDRIRDYPVTAPAARAYDAAFPDMLAGATKVRESITAGDAAGIAAGAQQLARGTATYQEARKEIAPLVEPALLMQRLLVK